MQKGHAALPGHECLLTVFRKSDKKKQNEKLLSQFADFQQFMPCYIEENAVKIRTLNLIINSTVKAINLRQV